MASPDGSVARRFARADAVARAGGVGGNVVAQGPNSGHRRRPEPPHHRHHHHLVPGDDVHPHQVDAPLRCVRRARRITGRAGRGRGHRRGDAVAAQPDDVRRRGAVRDGVVVRQRQRLVVRLELRRAVVECSSRSGTSASPPCCSAWPSWPCWWRRGSTSTATTARHPTHVPAAGTDHPVAVGDCRVAAGRVRGAVADPRR